MNIVFVFALLALVSLFPIVCSIKNYDWFFEHRKARFMVKILGRNGARIFYVLLGVVIMICSLIGMSTGGVN